MSLVIPFSQCIARPPEGGRDYPLADHLLEVAGRSGRASGDAIHQLQFLAGLLHDAGKAQQSWQRYIADPRRHRGAVPHAFLGAALFFLFALQLRRMYLQEYPHSADGIVAAIVQLTRDLADHHGELKGIDEASPPWEAGWRHGCLEETDLEGLWQFVRANFPPLQEVTEASWWREIPETVTRLPSLWRRMVIHHQARRPGNVASAADDVISKRWRTAQLIGADRFAVAGVTPRHLSPEEAAAALDRLLEFCRLRGDELAVRHRSSLTALRQQAQDAAVAAFVVAKASRFYTLRLPTGMGKTLTSLRIALEACRLGRAERVIYVAPYLTILSQAAREIRSASGLEVMEHHHLSILETYTVHESDPHELLLQESWQSPVVATTFNQLFRALAPRFAQDTIRIGAMRRAFVILDEPQIVDGDVWRLFLALVDAASTHLEMTVLLISATTPPLDGLREEAVDLTPGSLPSPCRYIINVGDRRMETEEVAEALVTAVNQRGAVAVILNTVEDCGRVYAETKRLSGPEISVFNLHGAMTSLHKNYQVQQIRRSLEAGLPTIVVATQIIEAGVDLSFRMIYRARPVLPSIIQAAGRANRHAAEGEPVAEIVDFHFLREGRETRGYVYDAIAMRVTDELLDRFTSVPESGTSTLSDEYFKELFRRKPGTSALAYVRDAAMGHWSDLQRISPFQQKGNRVPVFVPNEGPWIDDETYAFLSRFGAETPEQLYHLYLEKSWLRELAFVERKLFFGLLQRFVVPVSYRRARMISNLGETAKSEQPPAITLLRQPHLYREDSGFGYLVKDVEEWIYL